MENPTVEAPMASSNDHTQIVKRKRTKRQRVHLAITSSSSGGEDQLLYSQFSESTEEDEDMANCLIMLAQSGGRAEFHLENGRGDKLIGNGRRPSETAMKSGIDVYECKTCSRCFPSFQALGGHRASHKKPKAAAEEKLMTVMVMENNKDGGVSSKTFSLLQQHQLVKNNNKIRVHECSICGSEFSSGQALGGHMRRHRVIREIQEMKKPRNLLALDLNLPAPEDDLDSYNDFQTGFIDGFTRKQPLVFSVAALVDCHY